MNDTTQSHDKGTTRPSIVLLLAGMAALALAVPTLLGVAPAEFTGWFQAWMLVVPAVAIGLVLILAPVRRRKRR